MKIFLRHSSGSLSIFESPWLKRQVEGHLIFGLFTNSRKFTWALVVFLVCSSINSIINAQKAANIVEIFFSYQQFVLVVFLAYFAKVASYYQAAIWWCATKVALLIISPLFILLGVVSLFSGDKVSGLVGILLGAIWIPSFEFIPNVIPYQKIVTVLRLVLTAGIIFFDTYH